LALGENVENLVQTGTANLYGAGNYMNNTLIGNAGNNTLDGKEGDDILDGGAGADIMIGGTGNDTYIVDNVGDVVIESSRIAGEIDTVRTSIGLALGENVENLVQTGTANLYGAGNYMNNTLIGNAGDNTLDGKEGADIMNGGAGNDTYVVDNVGDRVIELGTSATEIDTVLSSIDYALTANVENLTLLGAASISG
ncbi:hypothetical protein K4754_28785, partial [Pseudomonas glycinae]|uniref:calcium-binding protein n=1 Tax=Pseudomonas glycinae TaxID=1785145 RepID=UPI002892E04D